ncbi:MAG: SWIM zinc finger family protein, partial [Clostridium sp.]
MEWRELFKQNVLNGAEEYIQSNAVQDLSIEEKLIIAKVIGIENYNVEIRLDKDKVSSMKCSCPYAGAGSNCRHMAAVMLAWESYTKAESKAEADEITELAA